jgi:hypothetical protein
MAAGGINVMVIKENILYLVREFGDGVTGLIVELVDC